MTIPPQKWPAAPLAEPIITVYAIRAGKSTWVKIGLSQAPMQRLANLPTASPEPLELLCAMPVANARAVE